MTKVYCCNFMEQIYQWFEYRKKLAGPFRLSYKTVVKDDCLERTRARSRIVCSAPQTFNHPLFFKSLLQPFLVWPKTSSFNISHFSRSFNLVRHQDLQEKRVSF